MKRYMGMAALAAGILLAGTSQAHGIAIGISLNGLGLGIGPGGVFLGAPVVYAPPPPPPPVVYAPPVIYAPVVYAPPPPVYVQPCSVSYVVPGPVIMTRRSDYGHGSWNREWRR